MFKLLEMIYFCILFNTSLDLFPNNWLRDTSIELDHPPNILNTFSSSFFSRFWMQGQVISRVDTVFA